MKLERPKLSDEKDSILKVFHSICAGLTLLAMYAILWTLVAALCYRIFLWLF